MTQTFTQKIVTLSLLVSLKAPQSIAGERPLQAFYDSHISIVKHLQPVSESVCRRQHQCNPIWLNKGPYLHLLLR